MNILITCIGHLHADAPVIRYNKGRIPARMTGEACCKYLLKKRGYAPDLVIALCMPDACKEDPEKDLLSGYGYFENAVLDFCDIEGIGAPAFEKVKITKGEETASYFGKSVYKVQQLIRENGSRDDTCILIDTACKAQPIHIMLQMMIRLLRNDGYQIIGSYYTSPEKETIAEDNTKHQLEMIEAISEFSEHGTADKIIACFNRDARKKPDPVVMRLVHAMQEFSESIQLCQTERLQDILNDEILPTLEEIENMSGAAAKREDVFTLRLMADDIRKKLGCTATGEPFTVTPMLLIEWCLRNGYIQQAVTLFVESIPKYLVRAGILKYNKTFDHPMNTAEGHLLYTMILSACCPKEKEPVSVPAANRNKNREARITLMKDYLQNGSVSQNDAPQISSFIETMQRFKTLIGNEKPAAALQNYTPENDAERLMVDTIRRCKTTSYEKLVNSVVTWKNVLEAYAVLHEEPAGQPAATPPEQPEEAAAEPSEIDKKLSGIEHFSIRTLQKNLRGIRLRIHRDRIRQFRRFLAYYVYIKKCVRNYLNHALEYSDALTAEQIAAFQSYSVHTGALTIRNITDNLTEALHCLDLCIIKESDAVRPVRKYYLPIPNRPQRTSIVDPGTKTIVQADGVPLKQYENPTGSPLLNHGSTRFPIIPVIANSVSPGETIRIYGIRSNSFTAPIWEEALFDELNDLIADKDFDYEYEVIEIPEHTDPGAPLMLFQALAATVDDGDRIYADLSDVNNMFPMVMTMFMNHVLHFRKGAVLEAAVYHQFERGLLASALYNIADLVYANHEMCNLDSSVDPRDALAVAMSFGMPESDDSGETDAGETDSGDSDETDEADAGTDDSSESGS